MTTTKTTAATETVTYEQYWNAVLGSIRDAEQVISEFGLADSPEQGPGSLDEWLGEAEAEAAAEATDGWPSMAALEPHHEHALAELKAAAAELAAEAE